MSQPVTTNTIPVNIRKHAIWPLPQQGRLQPIVGLHAKDTGSTLIWEASGNDPQFLLNTASSGVFTLPGGWYRLRMQIQTHAGILQNPCLYPMHAGHASEDTSIQLHVKDHWIDQVIFFSAKTQQLRFDPSTSPAEFSLDKVTLVRLGKAATLWHMLSTVQQHTQLGWRSLLKRALQHLLQKGPTQSAVALYNQYTTARTQQDIASSYAHWIDRYDRIYSTQTNNADELNKEPLISILLPVYNTPLQWLSRCINSVLEQTWAHWELCIVDDASTDPAVRELLAEYARNDPRIRVHLRDSNGHISVTSNDALTMAKGEFIVLLDHDDELRPHALMEVMNSLRQRPDLDFIYSDEDKIDENGQRFAPYFKPDWNPDLLLSQNYICHLAVIRTSLALRVGGFRTGYEGSQDHDLFLRCTAATTPEKIHHIPKILYHWRAITGSTALQNSAKGYALDAGVRALSDYLATVAPNAHVSQLPHGHYQIKWPLPSPAPKVSLIIPTRDRVELLRMCVDSILHNTHYPNYDILIVDNQSQQVDTLAYFEQLQQHPNIKIIPFNAAFNYSAINNDAVNKTDADVIGLVNNDIEVIHADWLDEMVSHAIRPGIGAVGAMLYYPNNTIQHAGTILGIGGVAAHIYHTCPRGFEGLATRALVAQNLSAVTAACLVVKRERYLECGGLNEKDLTVAFNDVDFCLRLLERGYRNVWTPFAELYHHESASRGLEDTPQKQARFRTEYEYMRKRWGHLLEDDPAYNPNLCLIRQDSSLAFPPRTRT